MSSQRANNLRVHVSAKDRSSATIYCLSCQSSSKSRNSWLSKAENQSIRWVNPWTLGKVKSSGKLTPRILLVKARALICLTKIRRVKTLTRCLCYLNQRLNLWCHRSAPWKASSSFNCSPKYTRKVLLTKMSPCTLATSSSTRAAERKERLVSSSLNRKENRFPK